MHGIMFVMLTAVCMRVCVCSYVLNSRRHKHAYIIGFKVLHLPCVTKSMQKDNLKVEKMDKKTFIQPIYAKMKKKLATKNKSAKRTA